RVIRADAERRDDEEDDEQDFPNLKRPPSRSSRLSFPHDARLRLADIVSSRQPRLAHRPSYRSLDSTRCSGAPSRRAPSAEPPSRLRRRFTVYAAMRVASAAPSRERIPCGRSSKTRPAASSTPSLTSRPSFDTVTFRTSMSFSSIFGEPYAAW